MPRLIWMKFIMLPQPAGLLKLMLQLFHRLIFKEEKFTYVIFIEYVCNIGVYLDTEFVCFKLYVMLVTIKLYSRIQA